MKTEAWLLHPNYLSRIPLLSWKLKRDLVRRCKAVAKATEGLKDPDLSVVIRTKNNESYMPSLLEDIKQQEYDGQVEIIVVDTESTDKTVEIAKKAGARVINIKQAEFSYPKSLNLGFEAAKMPYVVTIVGHSNLTNRYMFKALSYWSHQPKFGGMYGTPLPHLNGSKTEHWATVFGFGLRFKKPVIIHKPRMGILSSNAGIVKRSVWLEMGKFDEAYGAGGEDGVLGKQMLEKGYVIVRDPLCSVYHSHGVGIIEGWQQFKYWVKIAKPYAFSQAELEVYRRDLN